MALETLKNVKEINGKKVMTNDERPRVKPTGEVDWNKFDKMRNEFPICIDHEKDMISFKMLTKPASEGGNMNLCQLTDLIATGLEILKYFQNGPTAPCRENAIAITKIEESLMWQEKRTKDRIARNVEGKYEK